MSLPFLHPKRISSIIIAKNRLAEGGTVADTEKVEGEAHPELMAAAQSLISAVHSKDAEAVCEALEAAYAACSSDDYAGEESAEGEE